MDYYTRTVFEFTSDALGAQSGVAGGGRYDGLVEQLGGPRTPGCGWAAGIERILLAGPGLPSAPRPVDLYVAFDGEAQRAAAFAIAAGARDARMSAQMELAGRSRKGQLKQGDRLGARYVAIVEDGGTVLKDMQTGERKDVQAGEVVTRILRERGMS
jgi:histidyl-tRNA synthetase